VRSGEKPFPSSLSKRIMGIGFPPSRSSSPDFLQSLCLLLDFVLLGGNVFTDVWPPTFCLYILGLFLLIEETPSPKQANDDKKTYKKRQGEGHGENHGGSTVSCFRCGLPSWWELNINGSWI